MKITEYRQFEYDCRNTQELLTLLVVAPEELTLDERSEVEKHLAQCTACRQDYEGITLASDMLLANQDYLRNNAVFADTQSSSQQSVVMSDKESVEITFRERLIRASARRKRRERKQRVAKIKHFAKPISAIAACLIAALGLYLTASHLNPAKNITPIAATLHDTPVKIELLTASAAKIIPSGQQIIALATPKTLRINNNRYMTLNTGTELSIIPHNLGCIVKLEKGEIDTQVEHDGKPFIVATAHGRAVITGTTFNIKTNNRQMNLTVTEGTVRFESDKGFVNVKAGYTSAIAANSQPTNPIMLNENTIPYQIAADAMLEKIEIPLNQTPTVLTDINYQTWIKENRTWFKQQFPKIFQIKDALAKEGIETGYPELLVKSGYLRRFAYPPASSTKLLTPNPAVLTQLAAAYGKDQQWLTQTFGSNNFANNTTTSSDTAKINAKMFNKWQTSLQKAITNSIIIDSLHASIYLTKTRTLTWLTTAQTNSEAKKQNILADEIATTHKLTTQIIQLMKCGENNCKSDHPELLEKIIEGVGKIIEIESTLTK